MPKQKNTSAPNPYVNREISWLSFNARVLQEAADPAVPLLERLKFLGIFSSNLDEFFRVRVGSLMRLDNAGVKTKASFGSPKKVLEKINKVVLKQREKFDQTFTALHKELEAEKVFIINEKQLNPEQEGFVQSYFRQEVRPSLVPIMLEEVPRFPYLRNQVIYLAVHLSKANERENAKYALIEVPVVTLPRFIMLPGVEDRKYLIMLDDVIRYGLQEIFAIFDYDQISAYTIKLTRDAELEIDDDITKSSLEKISKSIKQRLQGQPVRFVYDREMPKDLLTYVLDRNKLADHDNVIPGGRYHNAKDFMSFPSVGAGHLEYSRRRALELSSIEESRSLIETIKARDVILHFPYQSFHYVIDLLREAAIDPKVVSIKMTLYRVAKNSNIINALVNARRNGKEVAVLLELKARFDEEANIFWTQSLEEAGAHLIDSVPGMKVHSKLCLITRKEGKKLVHYGIVGTGNYNETTARIYSDHALFTADPRLTKEIARVFEFLENNYRTFQYKHLIVSPFYMRKKFTKLIKAEIKNAEAGKSAYIFVKLNSLVDKKMIDLLYIASRAGVKIRMIIRGICSMVPGVPGLSENIEVISIVDKYLEHSRISVFCNGGDEKYFISSADWMVRNLDNRVEVTAPIYDPAVQRQLRDFFEIQWCDATKARVINEKQDNTYRIPEETCTSRAQDDLFDYLRNVACESPCPVNQDSDKED